MIAAADIDDFDQSAQHRQRPRALTGPLLVLLALALGGCVGVGTRSDGTLGDAAQPVPDRPAATEPLEADPGSADAASTEAQQPQEIWQRLRGGFQLGRIEHPRVEREIRRLQHSPNAFRALMARSEPYLYHILNAVESADLPTELALLPAVESGFQAHVHSPEGAAGLWQFMPATGRMLGLKQDWWFDKRRTVRASTEAAVHYLVRLNEQFDGDWLQTLAAYNAGSGTVGKAIRAASARGKPTDFWSLDLPGETDSYVPRLLALAAVVADPQAYGLDLPEVLDEPYFAPANTAGQIDLNVAAQLAGMPVQDLLVLNAGHRRWASRPEGPYELLLPVDKIDRFEEALASLPAEERLRWRQHHIKSGDSLSRIARQYGVSVEAIRRSNGLKDSRIRAGKNLLIPLSDSANLADAGANRHARQRMHYRVRRGDSLYVIARRFEVSVADLKRWNRVGRYIRPGERITVFIDPDA
ncbi:MAG: transglycosylase SLT domain-containing protein [Chromatiaceae bacterium]|nr:transglycosylase SLT domain-containing protein [Chromatiaceae bacterium]